MTMPRIAVGLALGGAIIVTYGMAVGTARGAFAAFPQARLVVAQAMVPPTAMTPVERSMTPEARMARRFPQPVLVGDLIGLAVLDQRDSTIGRVQRVVRTRQGKIDLIVRYGGWFGWGARPVAVPIEVVGIEGRQLASLDMPRSAYAAAATWQVGDGTPLPTDATISIALARN